jgi:hypothetical protein
MTKVELREVTARGDVEGRTVIWPPEGDMSARPSGTLDLHDVTVPGAGLLPSCVSDPSQNEMWVSIRGSGASASRWWRWR